MAGNQSKARHVLVLALVAMAVIGAVGAGLLQRDDLVPVIRADDPTNTPTITPTFGPTSTMANTPSTPLPTDANTPVSAGYDGTEAVPTMVTPVLTPLPSPTS